MCEKHLRCSCGARAGLVHLLLDLDLTRLTSASGNRKEVRGAAGQSMHTRRRETAPQNCDPTVWPAEMARREMSLLDTE